MIDMPTAVNLGTIGVKLRPGWSIPSVVTVPSGVPAGNTVVNEKVKKVSRSLALQFLLSSLLLLTITGPHWFLRWVCFSGASTSFHAADRCDSGDYLRPARPLQRWHFYPDGNPGLEVHFTVRIWSCCLCGTWLTNDSTQLVMLSWQTMSLRTRTFLVPPRWCRTVPTVSD